MKTVKGRKDVKRTDCIVNEAEITCYAKNEKRKVWKRFMEKVNEKTSEMGLRIQMLFNYR